MAWTLELTKPRSASRAKRGAGNKGIRSHGFLAVLRVFGGFWWFLAVFGGFWWCLVVFGGFQTFSSFLKFCKPPKVKIELFFFFFFSFSATSSSSFRLFSHNFGVLFAWSYCLEVQALHVWPYAMTIPAANMCGHRSTRIYFIQCCVRCSAFEACGVPNWPPNGQKWNLEFWRSVAYLRVDQKVRNTCFTWDDHWLGNHSKHMIFPSCEKLPMLKTGGSEWHIDHPPIP